MINKKEVKEVKNITVTKDDLQRIGHMANNGVTDQTEGFLCIMVDLNTANIEEIFLRNILNLYGYEIVESEEFWWENKDIPDIDFVTNMPWSEYSERFMNN